MLENMEGKINIITMGTYPQHNESNVDPIEWLALKNNSEVMLLISRYALITTEFADIKKATRDFCFIEWQNSLAREACKQFYETAFSPEEKEAMIERVYTDGEVKTSDYVFLLSEEEVIALMPEAEIRKAKPTPYALKKGARLGWTDDTREYTSWWIMPEIEDTKHDRPYTIQDGKKHYIDRFVYPKAVFQNGQIQFHGRNVFHKDFTIRPCIMINKNAYSS